MESQYQVTKFVREMFLSFSPRASFLPFSTTACDIFRALYDWKKLFLFAEQNRKTPARILKPLIDPRDKTLPAWNENIVRSSKPAPS